MSTASDQAVVIWGEVLWDRFPDGARLGGAPANVAWHLGLAGGWAQLVSRIGNDADGERALARLSTVCDVSLVQIDPERATGEVEVTIADGEPRYRLMPGRAWERIAWTCDVERAITEAGVLVYGTLAQRTSAGLDGWRAAVAAARGTCLKVCDVNLRKSENGHPENGPAVMEAIAAADVVKVNDRELATLAAWQGWADPIRELRQRRVLAVTHGAGGSTLYGESDVIEIPGMPASKGGDNVGCGDAFIAILVHGMTLGWDLGLSGRVASRWAAAVAEERGATPELTEERVEQLLSEASA